jgi:hypothetical protein
VPPLFSTGPQAPRAAACYRTSLLLWALDSWPSKSLPNPFELATNHPSNPPNRLDMNPLRPPSSSSRQRKAVQGRGAPTSLPTRSATTDSGTATPANGFSSTAVNPAAIAATTSPTLEVFNLPVFLCGAQVPCPWSPAKGIFFQ